MDKKEIIQLLLPILINKKLFIDLQKNGYYKYLKEEDIFQFFFVNILKENEYIVVVNEKSGNKSIFEQYKFKTVGNTSGVPDLFVLSKNNETKGYYFELKKAKSEIFKKNGDIRSFKTGTTKSNQIKFIETARRNKYYSEFVYPENVISILKYLSVIKLN